MLQGSTRGVRRHVQPAAHAYLLSPPCPYSRKGPLLPGPLSPAAVSLQLMRQHVVLEGFKATVTVAAAAAAEEVKAAAVARAIAGATAHRVARAAGAQEPAQGGAYPASADAVATSARRASMPIVHAISGYPNSGTLVRLSSSPCSFVVDAPEGQMLSPFHAHSVNPKRVWQLEQAVHMIMATRSSEGCSRPEARPRSISIMVPRPS